MKVSWLSLSLVPLACGGAASAPVAPPVVVDLAPAPAASAAPPPEPAPAETKEAESAQYGMIGLLDSADGGVDARGAMWGNAIDATDATGQGGLGLVGVAGGGTGSGIGLGSIGTLGHGAGLGTSNAPKVRAGAATVAGRLPPEVIQRIVRQSFGRFRLCYENGLRDNAKLAGKVMTRFTIEPNGSVSSASDTGASTMPDKKVVACVVRGFSALSFPQPEGGKVVVVYPIVFALGDDAPAAASKP